MKPVPDWAALSDLDAEVVVRDLLSAEWGLHVETFRRGPDDGVDLRARGASLKAGTAGPDDVLIGQVKHYPAANKATIVRAFAKEGKRSLRESSAQYFAVTTASLSAHAKRDIAAQFDPPLPDRNVLGREDLNAMLVRHEAVARRHLPLWLSDGLQLTKVLHSREHAMTAHVLREIQREAPKFVETRHLAHARLILSQQGAVVIAGPPGVGKTFLALQLLASELEAGASLVVAVDRLQDAEALVDESDGTQIIYYDDFLGSSLRSRFLEGKNEDGRLLTALREARAGQGPRLVLTTREYVLRAARQVHPRLAQQEFDLSRLIVDAGDFDAHERANIIYRHLYFSECEPILHARGLAYMWATVVASAAFNPRLVRLFVEASARRVRENAEIPQPETFIAELIDVFRDPTSLWREIYDEHLDPDHRRILETLSLLGRMPLSDLIEMSGLAAVKDSAPEQALFERRLLRFLEGDFVELVPFKDGTILVDMGNPSLHSYVLYGLAQRVEALIEICDKAVVWEQLRYVMQVLTRWVMGTDADLNYAETTEASQELHQGEELVPQPDELDRLGRSLLDALMRTITVGAYHFHPSLGARPRRWLLTPSFIPSRIPELLNLADTMGWFSEDIQFDRLLGLLTSYVLDGRSVNSEDLLESLDALVRLEHDRVIANSALMDACDAVFLGDLVDGDDFAYAHEYLVTVDRLDTADWRLRLQCAIAAYPTSETGSHRVDTSDELQKVIEEFANAADLFEVDVGVQLSSMSDQFGELPSANHEDYWPESRLGARRDLVAQAPYRLARAEVSDSDAFRACLLLSPPDD